MPGDPAGMPGAASPAIFGCSLSSFLIRSAGTCPSMMYGPMTAVWHECSDSGTLRCAATVCMSVVTSRFNLKPAAFMCSTHLPQQPQVGVRYTVPSTAADAGRCDADREAVATSRQITTRGSERKVIRQSYIAPFPFSPVRHRARGRRDDSSAAQPAIAYAEEVRPERRTP